MHRLTVEGQAEQVAAFRAAAAGSGSVAWRWDHDALAEDWFHLLMTAPHRNISASGARLLAHQLRDAVQEAHDRAAARMDRRSCPFDLNALRPVPAALLRRGADDPASLDWLWRHWGTTWPLRRVKVLVPELRLDGTASFCCSFCSADWTPWPALAWLRTRFPALRIDVVPVYA
jgi:hypothetical protein